MDTLNKKGTAAQQQRENLKTAILNWNWSKQHVEGVSWKDVKHSRAINMLDEIEQGMLSWSA